MAHVFFPLPLFIDFVLFGFCVLNEITLWIYYVYYWIETYPSMFYCHSRQPIIYLVSWPIQSTAMIVWQYESCTIEIDCCCWWWFPFLRASTIISMWEQAYLFRIFFSRYYRFVYKTVCFSFFYSSVSYTVYPSEMFTLQRSLITFQNTTDFTYLNWCPACIDVCLFE